MNMHILVSIETNTYIQTVSYIYIYIYNFSSLERFSLLDWNLVYSLGVKKKKMLQLPAINNFVRKL